MGDIFKDNGVKTIPSGNSTNEELAMKDINEDYEIQEAGKDEPAPDDGLGAEA